MYFASAISACLSFILAFTSEIYEVFSRLPNATAVLGGGGGIEGGSGGHSLIFSEGTSCLLS